eukprot:gene36168-47025_t
MSLTFGEDSAAGISFAKARIVGIKDEDRDHIHLTAVPSFAVFDGHGGNKSANICEEKLYAAISKSFSDNNAMLTDFSECPTTIHSEDIVDALYVKAIHDGVAAVHEASIRASETAGTTMCSLFLLPINYQNIVEESRKSSATAAMEPWQPPQADMAAAQLGLTNTPDFGRSYKVICANVGDSRCVMVGCSAEPVPIAANDSSGSPASVKTVTRNLSEEHSTPYMRRGSFSGKHSSPQQSGEHDTAPVRRGSVSAKESKTSIQSGIFDKLKRYVGSYSRSDVDTLSLSLHMDFSRHHDALDQHHIDEVSAHGGKAMQVSVRAVTLTEDHKPSNKRERYRVEQRLRVGQQVLPIPVKAFDQMDEDFVQLFYHRYFGNAYHPDFPPFVRDNSTASEGRQLRSHYLSSLFTNIAEVADKGKPEIENDPIWPRFKNQLLIDFQSPIFGSNINSAFLYRMHAATKLLQHVFADKLPAEETDRDEVRDVNAPLVRHFSSFQLRQGNTEGGPKGPEAYYPRHSNTSLLMTRSVGDKKGPRGCLARADITSVTVHATQHARFVLASDGVWDVIDEELIRKVGLYYKYKDPRDLAIYLAEKAVKLRTKQGLSKDDITVFVIDVNPQNAVFIKTAESKEGNHYYPAYHMNAAKKWAPMKSAAASPPSSPNTRKGFDFAGESGGALLTTMDIEEYCSSRRCSQS